VSDFGEHIHAHWFPVARSARVQRTPLAIELLGRSLVLARTRTGELIALEDRCPHRGVPLSAGRLCGEALQCAYHGWAFDSRGECVRMPGAPEQTPLASVRVPRYEVVEREGLVWLRRRQGGPLPERLLALPMGSRRFLNEMTWRAPIIEAQENFLDALHTHLVHPGLVRRDGVRRIVDVIARPATDGFRVDYEGQSTQTGLLYRLFESRRERESAHFSGLSIGQIEYGYANGSTVQITLCFSPVNAATTRVFAMLHVTGRSAPAWLVQLLVWPFLRRVARQDARMLGLQTLGRQRFPEHRHVVTPLDVVRPRLEAAWAGRPVLQESAPQQLWL
jgi:phenylpropionate dioxygenase-like ring-hydroxylating dioxygenase large terminal subunit